jgi:hypothetical protein
VASRKVSSVVNMGSYMLDVMTTGVRLLLSVALDEQACYVLRLIGNGVRIEYFISGQCGSQSNPAKALGCIATGHTG